MVFISITRLRLRSPLYILPFFWHTMRSSRQLSRDSRFLKGKTLMDKGLTFWTLTAWADAADMRAYRNSGAHKQAMPKLQHWCDEASVVHWEQEGEELPGWKEAYNRMVGEGRVSKIKYPSLNHATMQFAEPRYPYRAEMTLSKKK